MYKIGHFIFDIIGIDSKHIPVNFQKFKTNEQGDYRYTFQFVDRIDMPNQQLLVNKPTIKIVSDNHLETRYLILPGDTNIYALCKEIDDHQTNIYFNKDYIDYLQVDTCFTSLFLLERRMYQHHHYILHSAYIVDKGEAILFPAPSGVGKSTQADLWKKYRNVEIINGDRSLLVKEDDGFYAKGWPVCGSSKICHNKAYPIKAIVMLDQGPTNVATNPTYIVKTKRLLKEITVNFHNQDYVNQSFEFIDQLISEVPIVHLSCTISEEAVNCLDNYLKEVK